MITTLSAVFLLILTAGLGWAQGDREFEGVEIRVFAIEEPESRAMANPDLLEQFYQETGIRVIPEIVGSQAYTDRMQIESMAGTGAFDITRIGPGSRADVVAAGWVQPLEPWVDKYEFRDELDGYPASVLDSHAVIDGSLYGLPVNANIQLLAYRQDWFEDEAEKAAFRERYGYELRPPETTQELLDAAEFFTRDTTGDGRTDVFGFFERQAMLFPLAEVGYRLIWTWGGEIFAEDEDGSLSVAFDTDATVAALEWYRDLDQFMPATTVPGTFQEMESAWARGEIAMLYTWIGTMRNILDPELNPETHDVTGLILTPREETSGLSHGKTMLGGGSYAIHADSRNPEAAAQFLFWLMSEDQLDMYIAAGGAPPRTAFFEHPSVTESPIWTQIMPKWSDGLEFTGKNRVEVAGIIEPWHDILANMVSDVVFGNIEPADAVRAAAAETTRVLERAGY